MEKGAKVLLRCLVHIGGFTEGSKDQAAVDIGNDAAHSVTVVETVAAFRHGLLNDNHKRLFEIAFDIPVDQFLSPGAYEILRKSPNRTELMDLRASMASHGSFISRSLSPMDDARFDGLYTECKQIFGAARDHHRSVEETAKAFENNPRVNAVLEELREIALKIDGLYMEKLASKASSSA